MNAKTLKQRHRQVRDAQPEALRVRIHRAISWLARAEHESDDPDARFVFLWIAFNAAYASEFGFEKSQHEQAMAFVQQLLKFDHEQRLHELLYQQFTGPIRTLIDNRYVFEPFWRALRNHESGDAWREEFTRANKRAMYAVLNKEADVLLSIVLARLYVLRNQLIHGGATWNSAINRAQVADASAILDSLVPLTIELMMRAGERDFDAIAYPVV